MQAVLYVLFLLYIEGKGKKFCSLLDTHAQVTIIGSVRAVTPEKCYRLEYRQRKEEEK